MKQIAVITEAETIQLPSMIYDGTYTAIVVRIDVQGVEKTHQLVLRCPTGQYRRLKDALGGDETSMRSIFDCIASNIVNEETESRNYISFNRDDS